MARQTLRQKEEESKTRAARGTMSDPAVMASAGSVLLSWFFFFVRGDREQGLFVGLWAPTILAFSSYFKQTRMNRQLMASRTYGNIADTARKLLPTQSGSR